MAVRSALRSVRALLARNVFFFLVRISVRGWVNARAGRLEELGKLRKCSDLIWTRTHDIPACSIVPPPTTLQRRVRGTYGILMWKLLNAAVDWVSLLLRIWKVLCSSLGLETISLCASLCLFCACVLCRQRPCGELITLSRTRTECLQDSQFYIQSEWE
jgi:hypothetical protein